MLRFCMKLNVCDEIVHWIVPSFHFTTQKGFIKNIVLSILYVNVFAVDDCGMTRPWRFRTLFRDTLETQWNKTCSNAKLYITVVIKFVVGNILAKIGKIWARIYIYCTVQCAGRLRSSCLKLPGNRNLTVILGSRYKKMPEICWHFSK